jgi:hypothetical protein
MIESEDASKVVETLAKNLLGVAKNPVNFQKLPDNFWGYFARGHDKKGSFGIFVTYSEKESDVDDLIKIYEDWLAKNKSKPEIK